MNAPSEAGSRADAGKGRLLLLPTALADVAVTPLDEVLPAGCLRAAAALDHWIVENPKTARAFLGAVHAVCPLRVALQQHHIDALPKHRELDPAQARALLQPALRGTDIGVLSEAGAPCVADPGSLVVAQAHQLGLQVLPLVGPSSPTTAQVAPNPRAWGSPCWNGCAATIRPRWSACR